MPKKILSVKNLSVESEKSPNVSILKNISLNLSRGEIFALTGNSGAGKSMLCRTILGLKNFYQSPFFQSGEIIFFGKNILKSDDRDMLFLYQRKFSVLFQYPEVIFDPRLSIEQHMVQTLSLCLNLDRKTASLRIKSTIEKSGIPLDARVLSCPPLMLSRGTLQKLSLILALSKKAEIIIADEPASALDSISRFQVLSCLRQTCKQNHMSCLLVTHHLGEACRFADRIALMDEGIICEENTVREFIKNPRHPKSQALVEQTKKLYTANNIDRISLSF